MVAAQRVQAAPAAGMAAAQEWAIGNEVVLRTILGEEAAGTVYAFDKPTNMLLLKETGAHNGVSNLRFLKASCIKEVISQEAPKVPFDLKLPSVDMERCRKREERALQAAEVEASRVGLGVTKEAQAVFDALFKTMPCSWREKSIVVLGEITVDEPYTPEAARASEGHSAMLERVKKVLAAERLRLGL